MKPSAMAVANASADIDGSLFSDDRLVQSHPVPGSSSSDAMKWRQYGANCTTSSTDAIKQASKPNRSNLAIPALSNPVLMPASTIIEVIYVSGAGSES